MIFLQGGPKFEVTPLATNSEGASLSDRAISFQDFRPM